MTTKKEEKKETYYESIIKQGYSRRDFMKFATYMAAYMGLESTMVGQVAKALETTHQSSYYLGTFSRMYLL